MKRITIESGTNLTTDWAASFVKIGEAWEQFAEQQGFLVNGYLNSYGIKLDVWGKVKDAQQIHFEVEKKLENVNGSFLIPGFPHSAITNIICSGMNTPKEAKYWVKKNTVYNRLLSSFIVSTHTRKISNYLVIASHKNAFQAELSEDDILAFPRLYSWQLKDQSIHLKLLSTPDEVDGINKWLDACVKIIGKMKSA